MSDPLESCRYDTSLKCHPSKRPYRTSFDYCRNCLLAQLIEVVWQKR